MSKNALRNEATEELGRGTVDSKATAAKLHVAPRDGHGKLRDSLKHSRSTADVEGWATLRTQLHLARAEVEQAEEEVLALRSQLSAARKKERLHQDGSKAMINASRACSGEIRTLRHDNKELQKLVTTLQADQLATTDRSIKLESDVAELLAERDSLSERLREAERCIRVGAKERVRLEDQAIAATARCERLEAEVLDLNIQAFENNCGKAKAIDSLSADAQKVARQLELLQTAAERHADQASEQRAAKVTAEGRVATLELEASTLRCEIDTTKFELQQLRADSTDAAAIAQQQQWQVVQHAADLSLKKLSRRCLRRGFSGWIDVVHRLRLRKTICRGVLNRMQHRVQNVAFSRWQAQIALKRRRAAILSQCICRLQVAARATVISAWSQNAAKRKRNRSLLSNAIGKVRVRLMYSALCSWRAWFLTCRRHKVIVDRAVGRMHNDVACKVLSLWRVLVTQKFRTRCILSKHLTRRMNVAVYTTWCVALLSNLFFLNHPSFADGLHLRDVCFGHHVTGRRGMMQPCEVDGFSRCICRWFVDFRTA